jgi:hypothetical protein
MTARLCYLHRLPCSAAHPCKNQADDQSGGRPWACKKQKSNRFASSQPSSTISRRQRPVAPGDLVASDLIYPNRRGETYAVKYNPNHRWFYFPEMTPDEALLLTCYDSATDGRTRFGPHTAFVDPTTPTDAPPRESIELRTLVFHRQ